MSSALTIGVLDGVHIGHRRLLSALRPDLDSRVLTFEPHPVEVLRPGTDPRLITTMAERERLLLAAGVEYVEALDLALIKELSPPEFVKSFLVDRFDAAQVVVGHDFRFGKDRLGDVDLLAAMGGDLGFTVDAVDLVHDSEGPVSSSRIRSLIETGDIKAATRLLASYYTVGGAVVHGDKRGREIGFPTANLDPPERKVIPATGVYACWAAVDGRRYQAAVNVGVRPTFGGEDLVIEAFILGFDAEIYGVHLELQFVERLRAELAFESVESLVEQMEKDVQKTVAILSNNDGLPNVS